MSDQATADTKQPDSVAAYLASVEELHSADTTNYVDPHFAETRPSERAEIDGNDMPENLDVDGPGELGGPSEADLARGDGDVDPSGDGTQGLPSEEDEDPDVDPDVDTVEQTGDATTAKGKQFRVRAENAAEELAFTLRHANKNLSLKDALAEAERILGISQVSQTEETQVETEPSLPTPDEIEEQVADLEVQWRKAVADYAADEVTDALALQIKEAKLSIAKAREYHAKKGDAIERAYMESSTKAVELYPDAEVEGSELRSRMEEIHNALEAAGDPIISDPQKPIIIARMAAKELSIAPKRTGAGVKPPGTSATKAAPRSQASMTAPLSQNGRATTTRPTSQLLQQINSIDSPEAFENLVGALAGGR